MHRYFGFASKPEGLKTRLIDYTRRWSPSRVLGFTGLVLRALALGGCGVLTSGEARLHRGEQHFRVRIEGRPVNISWKATLMSAEGRQTVPQRSAEEVFRRQRHRNKSARGAQPGQSDRDEPTDRGLGRQAPSRCEGVEAVASELVGCDIVTDIAGLCDLA